MNELIKMYDYRSLNNTLGKPKYIFDIKKFEVYFSLVCSLLVTSIVSIFALTNMQDGKTDVIVTTTQDILLNATFGLLGMLGFIISGLAIISGTIGYKVTRQMVIEEKFKSLLSILFSFFYIGRFVGILIIFFISSYFSLGIRLPFNVYLYIIVCLALSFSLFFATFFSVSLLGTCINMFVLNYLYTTETIAPEQTNRSDEQFLDARINAITVILNTRFGVSREEFTDTVLHCINKDYQGEEREVLIRKFKEYYSIENHEK
ncbi:hypothetical protein [Peribacillus simplex]|uniref:hypothetical protein n=1 Tax=Peribacillus simplex TaxID=1478 RepID=UPI003CFCB19D